MPYVNIKITKENTTKEQKKELVSGVTELLEKVEKTQKELNSCKSELENLKDAMIV